MHILVGLSIAYGWNGIAMWARRSRARADPGSPSAEARSRGCVESDNVSFFVVFGVFYVVLQGVNGS